VGVASINVTLAYGRGDFVKAELKDVLHVPAMDSHILSSNVLVHNSFKVSIHPTRGTNIFFEKDDHIGATTIPP
jgi:hypothetical protein